MFDLSKDFTALGSVDAAKMSLVTKPNDGSMLPIPTNTTDIVISDFKK